MSTPNEDPVTAEQVKVMDTASREALVRAAATSALAEEGCRCVELLVPHVLPHLKAINVEAGVPMLVCAVDSKGNIRPGVKGPMSAREFVVLLRKDKEINAVGWRRKDY